MLQITEDAKQCLREITLFYHSFCPLFMGTVEESVDHICQLQKHTRPSVLGRFTLQLLTTVSAEFTDH